MSSEITLSQLGAPSFGPVLLFLEGSPAAKPWQPPSRRFPVYLAALSVRGVTSSISDRAPGHGTYPPGLCSIAPPAASTVELLHGVSGWLLLRALPPTHTHIYSRAATWPDAGHLSTARIHPKSKAFVNSHVPDRPRVRVLLAGVANVEIIDCELIPTRVFVRAASARGRGYKACRVCCARICMPPPPILHRIEIDLKNEMANAAELLSVACECQLRCTRARSRRSHRVAGAQGSSSTTRRSPCRRAWPAAASSSGVVASSRRCSSTRTTPFSTSSSRCEHALCVAAEPAAACMRLVCAAMRTPVCGTYSEAEHVVCVIVLLCSCCRVCTRFQ